MIYEIERKYLVNKYPKHLEVLYKYDIEQIYFELKDVSTSEEIRMRKVVNDDVISYYVTIKSAGNLVREETEYSITEITYDCVTAGATKSGLIPAITKEHTVFILPDCQHRIEYNVVDKEINGGWRYVEVEFNSIEEAESFDISKYISNAVEVTNDPNYKMRNYWLATRSNVFKPDEETACATTIALRPYVISVSDHINKSKQLMYDVKNKVGEYPNSGFTDDGSMFVIPGGFRNIRLAVMADEFKIHPPHFHFFKNTSPIDEVTGKGGGALLIKDTIHFKHDSHQDRINYVEIKALKKFLQSNYPGTDISIWQFMIIKWGEMNPQSIQKIDIDTPTPEYFHNMRVEFGKQSKNQNGKIR